MYYFMYSTWDLKLLIFLFCSPYPANRNFAFLQQIQEEFTRQYRARRIATANAYGMDKSFAPNFRSAIHYYNVNHSKLSQEEKVREIMTQVEDMKTIMGRNIKLSLLRAGNLERMLKKSEEMEIETEIFRRNTKNVRKRKQRKYYRVYGTLVIMVAAIVYLITAFACGWKLQCHAMIEGASNNGNDGGGDNAGNGGNWGEILGFNFLSNDIVQLLYSPCQPTLVQNMLPDIGSETTFLASPLFKFLTSVYILLLLRKPIIKIKFRVLKSSHLAFRNSLWKSRSSGPLPLVFTATV